MSKYLVTRQGLLACALVAACSLFLFPHGQHRPLHDKWNADENELLESKQKKQFIEAAFKQEFEKTKDPATNTLPRERIMLATAYMENYFLSHPQLRSIQGINWVERGPSVVGGRTRALIFDKRDVTSNTVFAAGVAGGIWMGTNISNPPPATPTWTKLTDVLDNIAISCIVQDPGNLNTLYVGTGETWGNSDAMKGLGIWKSTNGGSTWSQLSSTNNSQFNYTQKIVIQGSNLFAATGSGVKKSTNGGTSWSTVFSGNIADMEIAANNDLYFTNFFGRVYKSLAASEGATGSWVNVSPPGAYKRVELATAPSNSQKLYVLCEGPTSSNCDAIYRSDNGGGSWTSCTVPNIIDQGSNSNFTRGQAWYDMIAAVDPNNDNTVIIGGVDACRSNDGGVSWDQMSTWSLAGGAGAFLKIVHADQHAIVFAPGSSSRAVWGTDGGVYFTDNANVTITPTVKPDFDPKNNGYNVTQFYSCAMDPTAGSNYFLAGAQDNGSRKFNDGVAGIQATQQASGGDGAFCHIDQVNPIRQFTSYVYNVYYRSTNSGTSFSQITTNQARGSFINPTDYDPTTQILYGDATTVSTGVGGSYSRWTNPTSTLSFIPVTQFSSASVTNVCVSPITANRVYFGLANGSVVYVDGANTGTATKTGTIIKTGVGSVSGIAIEPGNENHMLVTYSNYGVQSVFESANALSGSPTWTNIEGNLPDMPVRWVIFSPASSDQALLATELGVWTTNDLNGAATEWNPTNGGLANTRVDMLKSRTSDNTIVAATHGRGLFTTTFTNTVLPSIHFKDIKTTLAETGNVATTCGLSYRDVPVTMMLTNPAASDVTVSIQVDGASTATEGRDFSLSANSLTFPAGSTQQSFNIRVLDDYNVESSESVLLNYSITAGAGVAEKGTTFQAYQLDITDDENIPSGSYVAQYTSGPVTTTLGPSSPLQGTQSDKKVQYMYRASELLAIGLKASDITSFNFSVSSKSSTLPYNGFTIKLGMVPATVTDLSAGFQSPSFTTVYSAPAGGFTPVMGENEFPISGFTWDGTSNIIIEFCFDNSAVNAADDIILGEGASFTSQAKRASTVTTDAGCGANPATAVSTFRPVLVFSQNVAATSIATVLNTNKQAYIGPNEKVHFFDGSGRIIATIQNMDNWDYGCTTLEIDRDGTSAIAFQDNNVQNYLAAKTIHVTPTNNNPSGNIQVTLYFTAAEKAGWETVTGRSWTQVGMVKVKNALISDVTPASPHTADVSNGIITGRGQVGTDEYITASFTTGFSGFGAGNINVVLPLTLLQFSGENVNGHAALEWITENELDNHGFEIEKSSNGTRFTRIGFVPASTDPATKHTYHFTDPSLINGRQFYRLKQIDRNGQFTYSAIVVVMEKGMPVTVSNPFRDYIDIIFNSSWTGTTEAELTDISGKRIFKAVTGSISGNRWKIFTGNKIIPPGVYILRLTNGSRSVTVKLIKS